MKRDDGFNGDAVVGFSSFPSNLASAPFAELSPPLPSDGAAVLEGVPRDRPRKLNVGRVRNGRCVDVADVSIAFSSGFFSSDIDEAVVDRRLKRLRAKMHEFIFCSPHQFKCAETEYVRE